MQNTKKLLSITNLKKYFPVAKSSMFQKEQLYVRANEDITLDIYEGETLGILLCFHGVSSQPVHRRPQRRRIQKNRPNPRGERGAVLADPFQFAFRLS